MGLSLWVMFRDSSTEGATKDTRALYQRPMESGAAHDMMLYTLPQTPQPTILLFLPLNLTGHRGEFRKSSKSRGGLNSPSASRRPMGPQSFPIRSS
jgi:hypothetical protein